MNPMELSAKLKHMASLIDNSKNPSRELVMKDLKKIAASLKLADGKKEVFSEDDMLEYLGKSEPYAIKWELDRKELPSGCFLREDNGKIVMQKGNDFGVRWNDSKRAWEKF